MLTAARQWAKRRGPALNHAHLHSLFRKHKIKLFVPATAQIKSISENSELPEGSQLLIPKDAVLPDVHRQENQTRSLPDLSTAQAIELADRLKQSVLHQDDDLLVINKPAGLLLKLFQTGHKTMMLQCCSNACIMPVS